MPLTSLKRRPLTARVTLFTLFIFVLTGWCLALYIGHSLRQDMQRLLGAQQSTAAAYMAANVEQELNLRLRSLTAVARSATDYSGFAPAALQAHLQQRPVLLSLFNAGVLLLGPDGVAIAESAYAPDRLGRDFSHVPGVVAALQQGKATVGAPVMDPQLQARVFGMTVPVRDRQGKLLGALCGITNLARPNFLDVLLVQRGGGPNGHVILTAPPLGVVLASAEQHLLPLALTLPSPERSTNVGGLEEQGLLTQIDPSGKEWLVSVTDLPDAGWRLSVWLPASEAFSPVHEMNQRILISTGLATVLAGLLIWWRLRSLLLPLQQAATRVAAMSASSLPTPALPIVRPDEIGQLVAGFNRLLQTLMEREQALRDSESRLRAIFDAEPECIKMIDAQGRLLMMNPAGLQMLEAESQEQLKSLTNFSFIAPEYRHDFGQLHHRVIAGESGQLEYEIISLKGQRRWMETHAVPIQQDGETVHLAVTRDITARKHADAELRIAAATFESRVATMLSDANLGVVRTNRAFSESTGYSATDIQGRMPQLIGGELYGERMHRAIMAALRRDGEWQGEVWELHKDGQRHPKWLHIAAIRGDDGVATHYLSSHYDISGRKRAEAAVLKLDREAGEARQRLRELVAQNEAKLEDERKHIAREVHDELGQVLTALRMSMSTLVMRFGASMPGLSDEMVRMKTLVDRAIGAVRNVAVNLRPAALDMGFVAAIEWLGSEFSTTTGVRCVVTPPEEPLRVAEPVAVAIFRIVQESLTNISRYAGATRVDINLGVEGGVLGVEVRDNGRGFDLSAEVGRHTFGLLGMRERAIAMGGHLDVISAPGHGTLIGLSVPLDATLGETTE